MLFLPDLGTKRQQRGQAIVEYIFLIAAVLSLLSVISVGFRRIQYTVWMPIVCETVAACPNCPTDPEVRARANQFAPGSCRR